MMMSQTLLSNTCQVPSRQTQAPKTDDLPMTDKAYSLQIIRSLPEFMALRERWDSFLTTAGVENLCLTHAWLTHWLQQFPPQELLIVIIKDPQENWLAVAPLKISRGSHGLGRKALRHLQFIGTQPNVYDWMKVVILPDEDETAVLNTLAQVIRQSAWDVLDFQFMLELAQCQILAKAIQAGHPKSAIDTTTVMPQLALPSTVNEYATVRRKKTRLEVNRHCNRFEKEMGMRPQLEFQTEESQRNEALAQFASAHCQYWISRGQKSDFQRFPKLLQFYTNLLNEAAQNEQPQAPKLMFSILKLGEQPLSYQLGFWQGSSYLSHLTNFNQAFRSFSPGILHMDQLVFRAIELGANSFNFGRGDEAYKHLWTREKQPLWNLKLFRHPLAKGLWALDGWLKRCLGKTPE